MSNTIEIESGGYLVPARFSNPIKYRIQTGKSPDAVIKRRGFVAAFCRFVYAKTGDRFSFINGYESIETDDYKMWLSQQDKVNE